MEDAPLPDAILHDSRLTAEQWEIAIAKLRQITASGSCAAHPAGLPEGEAKNDRNRSSPAGDGDDDDPDPQHDPRLGIPSVDLRDEQAFLDAKRESLKLPKMKIEAKHAIWARGKIIGCTWRGYAFTAHVGKRAFVLTHYRHDYPESSLLYITGQRRRVIQAQIW